MSIKLFKTKDNSVHIESLDFRFEDPRWARVHGYIVSVCGAVPVVTSGKDGTHSQNSQHYLGKAVDLRVKDWKGDVKQHAKAIAWLLGEPWLVLYEKDHLHIQAGTTNVNLARAENVAGATLIV